MRTKEEIDKMIAYCERKIIEFTPPEPKYCPTCGKAELIMYSGDLELFPNDRNTLREKIKLLKWVLNEDGC